LTFFHARNVVLEGDKVFTRLASVETEKFRKLLTVSSVFVDTKLKVLGELFVEFLVVFLVLLDFSEHFETLLDDVLLHHLEDFVLLKSLTRNV
jgi:hypothetical protein